MFVVTGIRDGFHRMVSTGQAPALVVLALLAVLPYLPAVSFPFVWDDQVFIQKNPAVHHLQSVERYFTDPDTLSSKQDYNRKIYRPLRTLVFAVTADGIGLVPAVFRLVNIGLHLGCVLLVFSLGLTFVNRRKTAFVAALLFAVHPVHSEAVTWISSLADGLSTFFYLATLRLILTNRPASKILALMILFPLALLSKEMAITFPFVLALLLWQAKGLSMSSYRIRLWHLGSAVAVAGVYFVWRSCVLGSAAQIPITWSGIAAAAMRLHLVLFEYVRMLVLPHPLCSLRMGFHGSTASYFHHAVALASLGAVTGLLWRFRNSSRRMLFFGLAFAVSLSPVLGFLPVVIHVAERFAYLPSVWFCLLAAEGLALLEARIPGKRIIAVLIAVVAVVFTAKLVLTNLSWRSAKSVFLAQVSCDPPDPNAFWNLGVEEGRLGQWEDALLSYKKYLSFDNSNPRGLNNLAYVYLQLKAWDQAEAASVKCLARSENNRIALNNLGAALLGKGRVDSAVEIYRRIVQRWPDDYFGQLNLGIALSAAGRLEEARHHLVNAGRIRPEHPVPRALIRQIETRAGSVLPPTEPLPAAQKEDY